MAVTVETGARLHFGFLNLSPERDRIYGSLGAGVDRPVVRVCVEQAEGIDCTHEEVAGFAEDAVSELDVPGAAIEVEESPPRHAGFGSGTQLALATLAGIARVYDREIDVRAAAPKLGRGGRSGIGVATFEGGGFVFDAGHERPADVSGTPPRHWRVPPVVLRRRLPASWRFVAVLPDVPSRVHGSTEARSMEQVIEAANPAIADRIGATVAGELLPALACADVERFGQALTRIDQLNGRWFRTAQSDAHHPAVGPVVDELSAAQAVAGVGQSSWGPTIYGVTTASQADEATRAGQRGLDRTGTDGEVMVLRPRNEGAAIIAGNNRRRNINLLHTAGDTKWTE